jgi:hypothetical protein
VDEKLLHYILVLERSRCARGKSDPPGEQLRRSIGILSMKLDAWRCQWRSAGENGAASGYRDDSSGAVATVEFLCDRIADRPCWSFFAIRIAPDSIELSVFGGLQPAARAPAF